MSRSALGSVPGMSRFGTLAAFLVAWHAGTCIGAHKWDRAAAERLLEQARLARTTVESSADSTRQQYEAAADLFRQVYRRDAHFSGADDAIYEAGLLFQKAAEKYGVLDDYQRAATQFEYLVTDYPASPFCSDALLRLGDLKAGPLQDEAAAAEAYEKLRARHPRSRAAKELAARRTPAPPSPDRTAPIAASAKATGPGEKSQSTPAPAPASPEGSRTTVHNIRHWSTSNYTRIVIDMDRETTFRKTLLADPDRLFFDISSARLSRDLSNKTFPVGDEFLKQVRVGQNRLDVVRVVLDFEHISDHSVFELHDPYRLVIDIHGARTGTAAPTKATESAPLPDELAGPGAPKSAHKKGEPAPAAKPAEAVAAAAAVTQPRKPVAAPPSSQTTPNPPGPSRPPVQPVKTSDGMAAKPPAGRAASQPVEPPPSTAPIDRPPPPGPAITGPSAEASSQPKTGPPEPAASGAGKGDHPPLPAPSLPPPKVAAPTSRGSRTLTRVLGLKIGRIVIDPGHGGYDTGTIGKGGLQEKDLVLAVANALKKQLEEKLGAEVFLTREDDRFIPLEERTAIANQLRADLFISIHANSSSSRATSGVETYYLDFARSEASREVAARENATSVRNISELEALIKKIVEADKSAESREFASTVQRKLYTGARQLFFTPRNRGVRSAPFVVLIGANMPSILAELAFISNPRDERVLKADGNRERLARALYSGIEDYMRSLGLEVAQNRGQ